MEKNNEIVKSVEKPDSIKVSRNAKGQHSFEMKRYFNSEEMPAEHVIDAMKSTEQKLIETFSDD